MVKSLMDEIPCIICIERKPSVDHSKGKRICDQCLEEIRDKKFNKAVSEANIPSRFMGETFESYICQADAQKHAIRDVKNFYEAIMSGEPKNMLLLGRVGTGKTHLSIALCKELLRAGVKSYYCNLRFFLARMKASFNTDKTEEITKPLFESKVLILDEFILKTDGEGFTSYEKDFLSTLVDSRYNDELALVLIANVTEERARKEIGQRGWSRISENCKVITFEWDDYRKVKATKGEV